MYILKAERTGFPNDLDSGGNKKRKTNDNAIISVCLQIILVTLNNILNAFMCAFIRAVDVYHYLQPRFRAPFLLHLWANHVT